MNGLWEVASESSPGKSYTVTQRPDTRNGGTYLHCTCPQWGVAIHKGGCKHVKRVSLEAGVSIESATGYAYPCPYCNLIFHTSKMEVIHERQHGRQHDKVSDADRLAAERILAWSR